MWIRLLSALLLVVPGTWCATARAATESLDLGRGIVATLRKPDHPSKPLPALLVFGGFESAGHVLDLVHPRVPVALASFDYPFTPPRKFEFPGSLSSAPALRRVFPETLSGIRRLSLALASRPDIDPDRITILGASFGAPFAVEAAAQDPELFRGVVIVHGFGRVRATAEAVILRSWRPRYGIWAAPLAWLLSVLGDAYLAIPPPERAAALLASTQSALMITAEQDSFIPRASSDALWHGFERSSARARERVLMPGDHLQPGSDALIARILDVVQDWLGRHQLL